MSVMCNLKEAIAVEKDIFNIIERAISMIEQTIKSCPSGNITRVSNNTFIVKLSALDSTNLSPVYYDPYAQARLVRSYLEKAQTATGLVNRLNKIIEDGYVEGYPARVRERLNKDTLSILKNLREELI